MICLMLNVLRCLVMLMILEFGFVIIKEGLVLINKLLVFVFDEVKLGVGFRYDYEV